MSFPFVQPYAGLSNSLQTAQATGGTVGGWVELGRTTLGGTGDTVSVGSLSDKRYYMVLGDIIPSGNVYTRTWLNGDTGTNYATRYSGSGAADATITSTNDTVTNKSTDTTPYFTVQYFSNLPSKEKLWINHSVEQQTAGAATAPERMESVNKWDNTSNAISTIQQTNEAAGDLASGTELVVLGWDPADEHTSNFWEELASVDLSGGSADQISSGTLSAKKYIWMQLYIEPTGAANINMTFNNDTSTNYAKRNSNDGGSDGTTTSASSLSMQTTATSAPSFHNLFMINNASNEKLIIHHAVAQNTAGASTAPQRKEQAMKWTNTSNQITEIDIDNTDTGSYDTKTILKVWGSD